MSDTLADLFAFDTMRAGDVPFVLDSWLKSYADGPVSQRPDSVAYLKRHRRVVERLVERCGVVILRPADWPDGIAGWACGCVEDDGAFVFHFSYVKRYARGKGLAWELLRRLGYDEQEQRVYTHVRTPWTKALERHGFTYDRERLHG